MFSGDFQLKLRKCNSKLRIYCGNDDSKPAGVYHVSDPETPLCGIDKSQVPEWPIYDDQTGRIIKGGWRRALRRLIEQGYVERRRAKQVFGVGEPMKRGPEYLGPAKDRIQKEVQDAYMRNMTKTGKPAMSKTDLMDIASEITKHASK